LCADKSYKFKVQSSKFKVSYQVTQFSRAAFATKSA
jgi:hypothetical protein